MDKLITMQKGGITKIVPSVRVNHWKEKGYKEVIEKKEVKKTAKKAGE